MIKYTEVRIGNLVYKNGEPAPVNAGDFLKVDLGAKELREIEPILLTPEWLEKCNAKVDGPYYLLSSRIGLMKNTVRDGSGDYDGFIIAVKVGLEMKILAGAKIIRFMHEAQNLLFDLTGEELTIK